MSKDFMDIRAELDALLALYDNPEMANPDASEITDRLTKLATCDDPKIATVAEEARQFWHAWGSLDRLQYPRLHEYRWHGFYMRMERLRELQNEFGLPVQVSLSKECRIFRTRELNGIE